MKQLKILLLPLFISAITNAQLTVLNNGYFFDDIEWRIQSITGQRIGTSYDGKKEMTYEDVMSHAIQSMTISSENKKGNKRTRTIEFNRKGRITSIQGNKEEVEVSYMNDTTPIKMIQRIGKNEMTIQREFDGNRLMGSTHSQNGKIKKQNKLTYNAAGKIASYDYFFGRKLKKTSKMNYFYDEENQKLARTEFYLKGKLNRVWNYDCSEQGELITKSTENESITQASSCDWQEESNDGSYIKYYRYINDGKVTTSKHYFTKDSVVYRRESFDDADRMTWLYELYDKYSVTSMINKRGKVYNKRIKMYSEAEVLEKEFVINNGLGSSNYLYDYTTNKDGFTTRRAYARNGKQKSESMYNYTTY